MFENIKTIEDFELASKRVLIRVDFNTPLKNGQVSDDTRIRASLPTIRYAKEHGGRVILMSHLGRPDGERMPEYSLEPVAARLAEILGEDVTLTDSAIGDGARKVVRDLRDGQVALLENLRFHPGETKNDETFARKLAEHGEIYINDAFGTAHRAHASTYGVARFIEQKGAGFLMIAEVRALAKLLSSPERPFVTILGGAKVSDKIAVIENLLNLVDVLIIGGAMANTFLSAQGAKLGKSLVETDREPLARDLLRRADEKRVQILLPEDLVAADSPDAESGKVVGLRDFPQNQMAVDIGPKTVAKFREALKRAATAFWNGPMGIFEKTPFAAGTFEVARAMVDSPAFTVVGGGDSAAAVRKAGLTQRFGHVSTGGGATLELLEGKDLPGISILAK